MEAAPILLAEGRLDWNKFERQSGRYGAVLIDTAAGPASFEGAPLGLHCRLVAEVTKVRESEHIGDWSKGVAPSVPAHGERILLGEGPLFVDLELEDVPPHVGVGKPDEWDGLPMLDLDALYRVHNQSVRLWAEPVDLNELSEGQRLLVSLLGCSSADAVQIEQRLCERNPGVDLTRLSSTWLHRAAAHVQQDLRDERDDA